MKLMLTTAIITALTITGCSKAPTSASAPKVVETITQTASIDTKSKAVLIYADWCGSCKILDPKIQEVKAMGPVPGLEFVTLDFTAKDNAAFFAQADAAGVGEAVRIHFGDTVKTGQLLLVDLDDSKVIGTVTKTDEPLGIVAALKGAVQAS